MADKCYICDMKFYEDKKNNYIKVRDRCHYTGKYRGAAHKICNLMYNTPREIPVVFHNGSSYDYHFIIKGLAEEFEGDFECLGENKEKYITFSVPIKKESNEDETISYRKKFIDSFRFMSTSLSTLADNLSNKIIENGKCKNCNCCLDYIKIKKSGEFECFNFKRRLQKLPNKSDFYCSLNMEDVSEIDYRHALKVFNKFNIKNLGQYHDLYVQSDTILLADAFESFRNL